MHTYLDTDMHHQQRGYIHDTEYVHRVHTEFLVYICTYNQSPIAHHVSYTPGETHVSHKSCCCSHLARRVNISINIISPITYNGHQSRN